MSLPSASSPNSSCSKRSDVMRAEFTVTKALAARPLQAGPDPEVVLEALAEAAEVLRDRLRQELAELRQEQAD